MPKKIPINAFRCPGCKNHRTVVIDWENLNGKKLLRTRACKECDTKFVTKEIIN